MLQKEFEEEEARSQQFLSKLKDIKKASKQIKTKNIQSVQRQEWCNEFQQLLKNEKILSQDLEDKLLLIEINSTLPKHMLSALNQQNIHSYNQVKDDLVSQLQNLKQLVNQLKGQLPSLKKTNQAKSQDQTQEQFKELVGEFKNFLILKQNGLEQEFSNYYQQFDDESDDNLDLFLQNQNLIKKSMEEIENDYQNDKLLAYGDNADEDETEILEPYKRALDLLVERVLLEFQSLIPKQRIKLTDEMLYLAGTSSIQRLILHYPKIPRTDLLNIMEYIRKQKDINRRIQIHRKNWKIEYQQLLGKSEQLLQDMQKDKIVKNQRWINYLELQQHRLKIQSELEEKRAEYEERQKIVQEKEQMQKELQEQIDKEKREEWLKHKAEIAQQALEFKKAKEETRQKFLEEQQIQQELQKIQQLQQIEQAKPHVQFRQGKEVSKIIDRKIKQEQKKAQAEYEQQRIENAINNYSCRPQVDFDFDRLVQETEARQIRKNVKYDKADKIQLSNVTGFNINQLMSDMRYRLQVALNDAGLQQTKYANELLNQMSKKQ